RNALGDAFSRSTSSVIRSAGVRGTARAGTAGFGFGRFFATGSGGGGGGGGGDVRAMNTTISPRRMPQSEPTRTYILKRVRLSTAMSSVVEERAGEACGLPGRGGGAFSSM